IMKTATIVALAVGLAVQTVVADTKKSCQPWTYTTENVGCKSNADGCVQGRCVSYVLWLRCYCPDDHPHLSCGYVCPKKF
ncbi:hypothetical protein E4U50_004100, partial [Claviceps purpurea]